MTEQPMPLMDALGALRRGLIIAGSAWLVAFAAVYGYAEALFRWLAEPMRQVLPQGSTMVFLTATEPFFTYLMLAAIVACVMDGLSDENSVALARELHCLSACDTSCFSFCWAVPDRIPTLGPSPTRTRTPTITSR